MGNGEVEEEEEEERICGIVHVDCTVREMIFVLSI